MEEQNSAKGQTFTLMIFGGIVVLCSIFFVLGMLVGRTQGLKIATVTAAEAASKAPDKEPVVEKRPELTFYDSVEKKKTPALEPVQPSKAEPKSPPPPAPVKTEEPAPASPNMVTLQIGAFGKSSVATKQVEDLKKKGFKAFIMAPAPGDDKPVYRVQVPAGDRAQAQLLKKQLEAAGFTAILKP